MARAFVQLPWTGWKLLLLLQPLFIPPNLIQQFRSIIQKSNMLYKQQQQLQFSPCFNMGGRGKEREAPDRQQEQLFGLCLVGHEKVGPIESRDILPLGPKQHSGATLWSLTLFTY